MRNELYMFRTPVCRLVLACAATAMAQSTFNISTVKPNAANDNRFTLQIRPGGNFVATGVPLKMLMREAYDVRDFQLSGAPGWPQIRLGRGSLTFKKANMTMFIRELGPQVGCTIVDNTGLTGEYDFAREFTPEPGQGGPFIPGTLPTPPIENGGPSIFTAIQEQLGLRLESQNGPVEMVVIDHVEKPSEN
jgi:hypothetical protein